MHHRRGSGPRSTVSAWSPRPARRFRRGKLSLPVGVLDQGCLGGARRALLRGVARCAWALRLGALVTKACQREQSARAVWSFWALQTRPQADRRNTMPEISACVRFASLGRTWAVMVLPSAVHATWCHCRRLTLALQGS